MTTSDLINNYCYMKINTSLFNIHCIEHVLNHKKYIEEKRKNFLIKKAQKIIEKYFSASVEDRKPFHY